jgi:hypothetical protein
MSLDRQADWKVSKQLVVEVRLPGVQMDVPEMLVLVLVLVGKMKRPVTVVVTTTVASTEGSVKGVDVEAIVVVTRAVWVWTTVDTSTVPWPDTDRRPTVARRAAARRRDRWASFILDES